MNMIINEKHKYLNSLEIPIDTLNGVEVMSIGSFARATKKDLHYIYSLINRGNSYGKLKVETLLRKQFVPVSEFYNFKFVDKEEGYHKYHFNPFGLKVYCE